MKKMIVAALALCLAVSAFAGIGVEWSTEAFGIYLNGSSGLDPTAVSELALTQSDIFWQLIFTGDTVKDDIDINNAAGGYLKEGGDDQVLAVRTIPQASEGATWDAVLTADDSTMWLVCGAPGGGDTVFQDPTWSTAGYVYERVFGGTPASGVWYYETGLSDALNTAWDPMTTPQSLYIDSQSGGAVLGEQIPQVPEPATMSLLGLGALAMVLRRKLRK